MEEEVTGSRGGGRVGEKKAVAAAVGEVEYKDKAGTAWSHSYLNQKPWHPLSYPNQRRKWIAEQVHANRARRHEEVQREFAQEQEFFRQTALFSKKDKEKMEIMKAVSFMYVRPPGYNAESAKAAEVEDEKKRSGEGDGTQDAAASNTTSMPDKERDKNPSGKKARPKDVFGRPLPTEEEFEVLKNAPRLETGAPARVKPFGVEIRNVRCLRCGNHGHQSGDRECPLKDVIMPNEESRLKRDDPLTAIMSQTDSSEPLKWELKQKPGMSPPRGGYSVDDPNQQIVADDIFDEYGGFLGGGDVPALLSNFSVSKSKKSSKSKSRLKQDESAAHGETRGHHSNHHSPSDFEADKGNRSSSGKIRKKYYSESSYSDAEVEAEKSKHKLEHKHKKKHLSESSSDSEVEADEGARRHPRREHRKKEKEHLRRLALSSISKGKDEMENKRHLRRSCEKQHYSDSSSSESNRHSRRLREKLHHGNSSPSESSRHSRRMREKQHHRDSSPYESNRHLRRLKEKRHDSDSSPSESNRHSRRLRKKRHRSDSSSSESNRHSRRSREKQHYIDSSAQDSSDSDLRNRHHHHHHHRRK